MSDVDWKFVNILDRQEELIEKGHAVPFTGKEEDLTPVRPERPTKKKGRFWDPYWDIR